METSDEWPDYYADPVGHCLAAFKYGNEHERFNAADILRGLGIDAESAVPVLVEAMRCDAMRSDENDQVRVQSAFALSEIVFRMGERAAFIVPALIETLLLHEDAEARSCAANVLRAIGPSARSAIPSLLQALQDKHEWVREAAQEALELLEE